MQKRCMIMWLFTIIIYLCSAQPVKEDPICKVKDAIATVNAQYMAAVIQQDSISFINCYTPDCWIMPPNAPTFCGPLAAIDFFDWQYKRHRLRKVKFISIDVFGDDNSFVTEEGFWQTFDDNNNMLDYGKFLVLWKKTDNGWRRHRDSFSSDQQQFMLPAK